MTLNTLDCLHQRSDQTQDDIHWTTEVREHPADEGARARLSKKIVFGAELRGFQRLDTLPG